eukprot:8543765-Pyramimonas_sp.AAC.1
MFGTGSAVGLASTVVACMVIGAMASWLRKCGASARLAPGHPLKALGARARRRFNSPSARLLALIAFGRFTGRLYPALRCRHWD